MPYRAQVGCLEHLAFEITEPCVGRARGGLIRAMDAPNTMAASTPLGDRPVEVVPLILTRRQFLHLLERLEH